MQNGAKLERRVSDAIKSLRYRNIVIGKRSVVGLSGNRRSIDVVAEWTSRAKKQNTPASERNILMMVECKDVRSKSASTYDNQMKRAYAELGDFQKLKCLKYVVVPTKRRWQGKHFNYDSYFHSIGVKLIGWNQEKGAFRSEIKKRFNSKWWRANHYPGREESKAKWVKEHR